MKKIILIVLVLVTFYNSNAQKEITLINKYGDLYFKFAKNEHKTPLPKFISIDAIKNDTIYAYIHGKDLSLLQALNIHYIPIDKAGHTKALNMATTTGQMVNWDHYPTDDVYIQMMQNFANSYPSICKLDTIGYSQQGRLILALKISDNPNSDEAEPQFFYTSTMHGDEVAGYVFMLRLIDTLLTSYNNNSDITNLINSTQIWINPLANPDGTYNGGNNDVSGATRYLSDGKDPNRDFPDPTGNQTPSGQWSQETIEMMQWAQKHRFVMSINFHSGAEVANYPWDIWTTSQNSHADDNWWQFVASEYAQNTFSASENNGYFSGVSSNGIIEGGDWYVVSGSRQDYMNYYRHCREMTVELSNDKLLSSDQLPIYWHYNSKALIDYIKQVHYGFYGTVIDSCTGQPIVAKIEILNHDRDGSEVYSSQIHGDYYRPIYAGNYSIIISAQGYDTVTYNNVSISNNQSIQLNAALTPQNPIADFSIDSSNACNGEYTFFNNSTQNCDYLWYFGDGTSSTETNPIHIYTNNGTYNIKLHVTNSCGSEDSTTYTINVDRPDIIFNNAYFCNAENITFDIAGDGTTYWYTSSASTSPFYIGNQYTLYNVSSDTTFYIENVIPGDTSTGGESRVNSGGSFYTGYVKHGLYFNVNEHVTLYSVDVNANSSGNKDIIITAPDGTTILDTNIYINAGIQTIILNTDLPVQDSLLIKCNTSSPDLYRNNTSISYPYNIDNKVQITTSTAGQGYYYFFYNWKIIGQSCKSARKPIHAYHYNGNPQASFTYNSTQNGIQFHNTSTGASSYSWDFGDGTTSTETNPLHIYNGNQENYTVTLIAYNSCGSDTTAQDIIYIASNFTELTKIKISPNPFNNIFMIKSQTPITEIEIISLSGKVFMQKQLSSQNKVQINAQTLPQGIYILKIQTAENTILKKIMKN